MKCSTKSILLEKTSAGGSLMGNCGHQNTYQALILYFLFLAPFPVLSLYPTPGSSMPQAHGAAPKLHEIYFQWLTMLQQRRLTFTVLVYNIHVPNATHHLKQE